MLKELILLLSLLLPTITNATTYLCGDSLMVGMSKYFKDYIIDCKNIAVCGTNIYNVRLPTLKDDDIVFISLGTNDIYTNMYKSRLTAICTELKKTQARVIWLLPPKMKREDLVIRLPKIREAIKEKCMKHNIEIIDLASVNEANKHHLRDGVHFSYIGYEMLVKYIMECV